MTATNYERRNSIPLAGDPLAGDLLAGTREALPFRDNIESFVLPGRTA